MKTTFKTTFFASGLALVLGCAVAPGLAVADDAPVTAKTTSEHAQRTAHKAERVVSDSWITTKVKSELLGDSISKGVDVGVETTHGVVILNGRLPTAAAIDHVKHIAQGVDGVKDVSTSGLTVSSY